VLGGGGGQSWPLEGDVGAGNFPEDAEACRLLAKAGLLRVEDPYYFLKAMAMVRADLLSGAAQRESEALAALKTARSVDLSPIENVRAGNAYAAELNVANAMRATARAVARPGFYEAKGHLLRLMKACERAVEAARKACDRGKRRPATTAEWQLHRLACDMWVAAESLRVAEDAYKKLVDSKVFAPAGTTWSQEEIARFDKAVREVEVPKTKKGDFWGKISDVVVTRSSEQCMNIYYPPSPMIRGHWSEAEHAKFVAALAVHGRDWVKVAYAVGSRTLAQVRSHAQKHFLKQKDLANAPRGSGDPAREIKSTQCPA
jgi:SHAQKYF class myb-like DNA-binding protein